MKCGVLLFCTLIIQLTLAKPGDYGTYGGEYGGGVGSVGGGIENRGGGAYQNLQESPVAGLVATTDLKPASTFDIGYGSPEPSFPYFPSFRSYGGGWGGWKQPQHIIAPIQVIAKPIHVPILPFGWGWQNPGIF